MKRLYRSLAVMALAVAPAVALAHPPRIYHRVTNLVAHPNGTLQIHLPMHDVTIYVKKGDSVTVVAEIWASTDSKSEKRSIIRRLAPKVRAQGDDVLITAPQEHGWHLDFGWGGGPQALVAVTVPPDMAVHYQLGSGDFRFDNPGAPNAIRGYSGSGDVHVRSASKQLSTRTGSGDVSVALDGSPGRVTLHTGSGDIDLSGPAASLRAETGSGDISVHGAPAKQVSLHTGSGDIVSHWTSAVTGGSLAATSGSGDIVMYFPSDAVLGGTISTGSGDVDSAFPVEVHGSHSSYTLTGGDSALALDVNTGSGDVTLRKD